jgi:hypothetical protein
MFDNRTPADRAALDKAVQKKLGKRGRTRGDIATALGDGATPRMVSDALRRLVAAGKAARTGPRNTPLYAAAAPSRAP